jgi:citrate lyase subunit beta/citryl-CoA lyase
MGGVGCGLRPVDWRLAFGSDLSSALRPGGPCAIATPLESKAMTAAPSDAFFNRIVSIDRIVDPPCLPCCRAAIVAVLIQTVDLPTPRRNPSGPIATTRLGRPNTRFAAHSLLPYSPAEPSETDMMLNRPRRSVLYMPATNDRAIEKARSLPIDGVALDLEDSIAPERKDEARAAAVAAIQAGGFGSREVVLRLNGPATEWFDADLVAAVSSGPEAILVPKVERPEQIRIIGERLRALGAKPSLRLWIMMETPLAVLNAHAIAECAQRWPDSRLSCLVLGTNDIQKETHALDHPDRMPLLMALQTSVFAARAYGLTILDGVYNNFRDLDGFRRECSQGRLLGMDGKTLIHPAQIPVANEIFSPSLAMLERARRIMSAFDAPESKGKGAISLDGEMVELLHLEIARRMLALADAVAPPPPPQ